MTTVSNYPVRVEASLDRPSSRWLWLVKWLLAIPHASRSLTVRGDVGATVPALTGIVVGLLVGGALWVAGGLLLVVLAVRRAAGARS